MRYLHERGYVALTTDQVIDFIKEGKAPYGKIVAILSTMGGSLPWRHCRYLSVRLQRHL